MQKIENRTMRLVRYFFWANKKIIVFGLRTIIRLYLTILAIAAVPMIYFLVLISIEPRSFPKLNNYIAQKVGTKIPGSEIDFSKGAIFLNHRNWRISYRLNDVTLNVEDAPINLSEVVVEISFPKLFLFMLSVEDLVILNSHVKFDLEKSVFQTGDKREMDTENMVEIAENLVELARAKKIPIRALSLRNSSITLVDNRRLKRPYVIKIIDSDMSLYNNRGNMSMNQYILANVNNEKTNTEFKQECLIFKNRRSYCNIDFKNLNISSFLEILPKDSTASYYSKNINADVDGHASIAIYDYSRVGNLRFSATSSSGWFELDKWFSQRIDFQNLTARGRFTNNFSNIYLDYVNTKFDGTDFFMDMALEHDSAITKTKMNFDIKNIELVELNKLWPSFLDQLGIRDWVVEHVIGGKSPRAVAYLEFLEHDIEEPDDGLQNVTSRVEMKDAVLEYADSFPRVTNINGVAEFRMDGMTIKFDGAKILDSNVEGGKITKSFEDEGPMFIEAKTTGRLRDLFIHINKNISDDISEIVGLFADNEVAVTNIKISLPLEDDEITIKNSGINIKSAVVNNNSEYIVNNSAMDLTLNKKAGSETIGGLINLKDAEIKALALGMHKNKGVDLEVDYTLLLKNDRIVIENISPKGNPDYKFIVTGFMMDDWSRKEFNINNFNYLNSNYDIFVKNNVADGVSNYFVSLVGPSIDLAKGIAALDGDLLEKKATPSGDSKYTLDLKATFQTIELMNGKRLNNPYFELFCSNDGCNRAILYADFMANNSVNLEAYIGDDGRIKYFVRSTNFGYLLSGLDIIDMVNGGGGEVKGKIYKNKKDRLILEGSVSINSRYYIISENVDESKVSADIEKDKQTDKIGDLLGGGSNVYFSKLRGDFILGNGTLYVENAVFGGGSLGFGIVLSGSIVMDTQKIDMEGLIVPAEKINTLFGISRIPIIGSVIFGEKDSGIFASTIKITQEDKNSKLKVKVSKMSMIMPGFFRNIFTQLNEAAHELRR